MLDSITEAQVWDDDQFCLSRTQRILIDSTNPRVELEISEVSYKGVFDRIADLVNFKNSYCDNCRNYKDGSCKVLCSAIEGRVQEEIEKCNDGSYICRKMKTKKSK
jgi:hypothetical protein